MFIKYKEYARQRYERRYREYKYAVNKGTVDFNKLSGKDAEILLNVILEYSELHHLDCSDMILHLGLDRLLISNLNNKDNKILAFKNIGLSGIPSMYVLLKSYWYSDDFEESYFSLYYTIYFGRHNDSYMEILEAVFEAKFSSERKAEMIRFMRLDNEIILNLCKKYPEHRNILLPGLNGEDMTESQYEIVRSFGPKDYIFAVRQLAEYGAYNLLEDAVRGDDIELRRRIALELTNKVYPGGFDLLCTLINDEDFAVRFNAALGILMYRQGLQYLRAMNGYKDSDAACDMAHLHIAMQRKE